MSFAAIGVPRLLFLPTASSYLLLKLIAMRFFHLLFPFVYFSSHCLVRALPARPISSPLVKSTCVRSGINSTSISRALRFSPNNPTNALDIFFCNPGEPIPADEAISALSSAITDVLTYLPYHRDDPIPGQAFQKSTVFWPSKDRVTTFVHTVRDHELAWLELAQILTEIQGYMGGAGGGPRQQRFHELEFHVRYENEEIALGRIQYTPGEQLARRGITPLLIFRGSSNKKVFHLTPIANGHLTHQIFDRFGHIYNSLPTCLCTFGSLQLTTANDHIQSVVPLPTLQFVHSQKPLPTSFPLISIFHPSSWNLASSSIKLGIRFNPSINH